MKHETWHMKPNSSSTSTWAKWPFSCSNLVKSALYHTPSDPSKNKDCILNSKYQKLKSSALPKGTSWSWNFILLFCTAHSLYLFVVVIKQWAKQFMFVYIFYFIPLCHMFFPFKIHSFLPKINLLEEKKQILRRQGGLWARGLRPEQLSSTMSMKPGKWAQ